MNRAALKRKYKARVAKGAALLDAKSPGWETRFIHWGKRNGFDMSSTDSCILGNTYADAAHDDNFFDGFEAGKIKLGNLTYKHVSGHGFDISMGEAQKHRKASYTILAECWHELILKRVKKTKLEPELKQVWGSRPNAY